MAAPAFKIAPDAAGEKKPSKLIPTACFTTDATDETTMRFYDAEDGSVATGVWECPPCKLEIPSYPVNEMMTIISGSLTITNADGKNIKVKSVYKWAISFGGGTLCLAPTIMRTPTVTTRSSGR